MRYPMPPRYYQWVSRTDRRIRCECGHQFTPPMTPRKGDAVLVCRGNIDRGGCGLKLMVMVIRNYDLKLVVRVTDADISHIERLHMRADTQLAYLLSRPLRAHS